MSALLDEKIMKQVREAFEALQHPVQLLFFATRQECEYCDEMRELLQSVVSTSDKLSLSVYDIDDDGAVARQYNVDKAPGLVIAAQDGDQITDYGIRYAGIPAGYEFSALVRDVSLVSGRDSGLSESTRAFLKRLDQPVLLQVFVTPTCPYCSRAVVLAHQMALESPLVQAEMVEAMEFPDLSDRYGVSGVPHTTINEGAGTMVGAAPEHYLVAEIQRALAAPVSTN
jgi:glutaredoxin-like protein